MIFTLNRTQVIERLKAQHALAIKHDKKVEARHRIEEREFLAKFRTACAAAKKWTYAEAKGSEFNVASLIPGYNPHLYRGGIQPSCPQAIAPQIAEQIRLFGITTQERFTIDGRGRWRTLHRLLTWTPNPIEQSDVCS